MFKVASATASEKGTSVKIRDYTRSCKFLNPSVPSLITTACKGGKVAQMKQVRRPADMCVKQAFEVKECWQANGQKAGIGDGL